MNVTTEALAFRIWAYATPREWNCTAGEIGEALGVSGRTIGQICAVKNWNRRLRQTVWDSGPLGYHGALATFRDFLEMAAEYAPHKDGEE